LRILEFDEVADTIPCRPARQFIGLGCDIFSFRIFVFADLALALASVFLVKLVNRTLGLRNGLLTARFGSLVTRLDLVGLALAPLPDDFRFLGVDLLGQDGSL